MGLPFLYKNKKENMDFGKKEAAPMPFSDMINDVYYKYKSFLCISSSLSIISLFNMGFQFALRDRSVLLCPSSPTSHLPPFHLLYKDTYIVKLNVQEFVLPPPFSNLDY